MKILLTTLNAKYIHSNLALKYLYGAAGQNREFLEIKEFSINNDDDYIYTEIYRGSYAAVCFSCYIWNIERILSLAENIKKAQPDIRIIFGGPEVSFDAVLLMKNHTFVDFIIVGEGEIPFCRLLQCLLTGSEEYGEIESLVYRIGGREVCQNPREKLRAFQQTPFPYDFLTGEEDKIIYYESTRGCPYRCSYCLSSVDKTIRSLPLERVFSELSYFLYRKVKQVKLIDRTFNWDQKRAYEIMRYLITKDNGITNFHVELCGDEISEELLGLLCLARPGLFQFEIGIQSTNAESLAACNRHSDFEKIKENVKRILEYENIHVHLDLIAGLPYEDLASFRRSFNDVYALRAQQLQLGFLKLLKGSPLREQAKEYGYVFRAKPPYEVISSGTMEASAFVQLKMLEHVFDLYYNRGGFEKTLEFAIAVFSKSAFDFYDSLAQYYYAKGFQHRSHKKEDLYRILCSYAEDNETVNRSTRVRIVELLSLDMRKTLNPDAVKKFERKGWEIQ